MALCDEVKLLERVPLFSCLDGVRLKKLAFSSQRVHFDPGDILFRKGDEADCAYILVNGTAEVLGHGPAGDVCIERIPQGHLVGEVALLCGGPRPATVRAVTPLDALLIEPRAFLRLLSEDRDACVGMVRQLARRLAATTSELIAARTGGDGGGSGGATGGPAEGADGQGDQGGQGQDA